MVTPEQDGVEEEEDEADIDVKDVAQDVKFFELLEFVEFGGDSEKTLVFRQAAKVTYDWD